MKCKDCRHMQVPKNGMAKYALANCAKQPDWKYMSLRFDRNCGTYQVATEAEIELKRKQILYGRIQFHRWQRVGCAGKLRMHLIEMVVVNMRIPERMYKISRLQIAYLSDHQGQ